MRCKEVVTILDASPGDRLPEPIVAHLSACPACAETWKDLRLLRAGFYMLAKDEAPESSIGFGARVVRRLDDALDSGGAAAEFIERIGRRFVLASLLLAMSVLLGLVLPASGPFRGPAADEPYLAQTDARTRADASPLGVEFVDTQDAAPINSTTGGEQKQK
jgi:hypothetical protein